MRLRRVVIALAMIAILPTVATACSAERSIPAPTIGAAWGELVVPFDESIKLDGGFAIADSDNDPSADLTVAPEDTLEFTASYVNDTGAASHFFLSLHAPEPRMTWIVEGSAQLTIGTKKTDLDADARTLFRTAPGRDLGVLQSGEKATLRYLTKAGLLKCGTASGAYTFRITDADGNRNERDVKLTIAAAAECETSAPPTSTPSP